MQPEIQDDIERILNLNCEKLKFARQAVIDVALRQERNDWNAGDYDRLINKFMKLPYGQAAIYFLRKRRDRKKQE